MLTLILNLFIYLYNILYLYKVYIYIYISKRVLFLSLSFSLARILIILSHAHSLFRARVLILSPHLLLVLPRVTLSLSFALCHSLFLLSYLIIFFLSFSSPNNNNDYNPSAVSSFSHILFARLALVLRPPRAQFVPFATLYRHLISLRFRFRSRCDG